MQSLAPALVRSSIPQRRLVDELMGHAIEVLRENILSFKLPVSVHINETKTVGAYNPGDLISASLYHSSNDVAIALSSHGACYNGRPITAILIPPLYEGSLRVNGSYNAVGIDVFFEYKEGAITPYITKEPLQPNALHKSYQAEPILRCPGMQRIVLPTSDLEEITSHKIRTKEFAVAAQIPTPVYHTLTSGASSTQCLMAIRSFIQRTSSECFVVKGDCGSKGNEVKMFNASEISDAVTFARKLIESGKRVLLEKRAIPLQWKKDGVVMDWNIRSIVTCTPEPLWVDAEVRYARTSNNPVNICKGGGAAELYHVAAQTGMSISEIRKFSLAVAHKLHTHLVSLGLPGLGVLGLDIIVERDGPCLIEVNSSNVGGFSTLMNLRHDFLSGVPGMLSAFGLFMERNQPKAAYFDRFLPPDQFSTYLVGNSLLQSKDPAQYIWALNTAQDTNRRLSGRMFYYNYRVLGEALFKLGFFEKAIEPLQNAIRLYDDTYSVYYLALSLSALGEKEEALELFQRYHKVYPEHLGCLIELSYLSADLGEAKKALRCADMAFALYLKEENEYTKKNFTHLYLTIAKVFISDKVTDNALACVEFAVGINPSSYDAFAMLSDIYLDKQEFRKAIRSLKKAIRNGFLIEYPDKKEVCTDSLVNAHVGLGFHHFQLKRYTRAVKEYRKALELRPSASVSCMLAHALIGQGNATLALRSLNKALQNDDPFNYFDVYIDLPLTKVSPALKKHLCLTLSEVAYRARIFSETERWSRRASYY